MSDQPAAPKPIEGRLIKRSVGKALGMMAFMVFLFLLSASLAAAWWFEIFIPIPSAPAQVNLGGGLLGIAGAMAGLGLGIAIIVSLVNNDQLIVGDDRLQIIRRGKQVIVQIPFANIAQIVCVNDQGIKFLGVNFENPDDPDTFSATWSFKDHLAGTGWHYAIHGGFHENLEEIHRIVLDRLCERKNA